MSWSLNSKIQCAAGKATISELKTFCDSSVFTYDVRHSLTLPPSLTPAAMKKLVEKRNAQFSDAVNESVYPFRETYSLDSYLITGSWPKHPRPRTLLLCYKQLDAHLFP